MLRLLGHRLKRSRLLAVAVLAAAVAACSNSDTSARQGGPAADIFDMAMIADAGTAACSFTSTGTVDVGGISIEQFAVSYLSWQYVNGTGLVPISINAYAARPSGSVGTLPGVVFAHGLGGSADIDTPSQWAALSGTFVLMYDGPGSGASGGTINAYELFNSLEDVRGSWFWAHAVAAMRALTCLADNPGVDSTRLAMIGGSAGGIATLLSAAVDERIVAAIPISASLALEQAVTSPDAWEHTLLAAAGLTVASSEWTRLMDTVFDPAFAAGTSAEVMMINGSTDEYFPLNAFQATFDALPGTPRASIIANFDHQCYIIDAAEDPAVITARADLRILGNTLMWLGHWFGTDAAFAELPAAPVLATAGGAIGTAVTAGVDLPAGYTVAEATFWWSDDSGLTFSSLALGESGGAYIGETPVAISADAVSFVDILYASTETVPRHFSLSSAVQMPAALVPSIRPVLSCI